jgi:hypothetical protein
VTGPYEEDDSVPLRLQAVVARPDGWRGRSSSIVAVGLVAFVGFALVLGTAFDDGRPAGTQALAAVSPTASPTRPPTATPTRRPDPLPTQLPRIEVLGGDIPTEQRLVDGYGLMRFDLSTGELSQLASPLDYTAQLLPSGEIVCACVVRDATANGGRGSSTLRFGRYDPAGSPILESEVRSFDGTVEVPTMGEGFNVVAGLEPGGARLFVLVVERRTLVWTITLLGIDTETGEVLSTIDVGDIPSNPDADASPSASPTPPPTPAGDETTPDGTYLWPATLTVAPGGDSAYAAIERWDVDQEVWSGRLLEWMIDLGAASTPEARPLPVDVVLQAGSGCPDQPTFVDASTLVRVCTSPFNGTFSVRRIRSDGTSPGDIPVTSSVLDGSSPVTVVVDADRRAVFLWDPQRHDLVRTNVDTGRIDTASVPANLLPIAGRGIGDFGYIGGGPGIIESNEGDRLYALGGIGAVGGTLGAPSGIWVFDPNTLELLDHWPARAFLTSLGMSGDGRYLYASGAAGLDVDGRENPWLASVTVYDVSTGEIQVVYGSVAGDGWVRFLPLPEATP